MCRQQGNADHDWMPRLNGLARSTSEAEGQHTEMFESNRAQSH